MRSVKIPSRSAALAVLAVIAVGGALMRVRGPKEDAETIAYPPAEAGKTVSSSERISPLEQHAGKPQPMSSRQSHTTAGTVPIEVLTEPPADVGEPLEVDDDPAWLVTAEDEEAAEIGPELAAEDPLSLEPAAVKKET